MTTQEAKAIAFFHLNNRYRILASSSEAVVTFPEFNPERAVQTVARVEWPAMVSCRDVKLVHHICDGDARLPDSIINGIIKRERIN